MKLKSVSTFALYQQRSNTARRLESDLATVTQELSSGVKADVARSLGAGVGGVYSARGDLESVLSYLQSAETFTRRTDLLSLALVQSDATVVDLVTATTANTPDPGVSLTSLKGAAEAAIATLSDALNVSVDGRFLFSGVDFDRAPFGEIDAPHPVSGLSPREVIEDIISGAAYAPAQPPAFAAYTAAEAATAIARIDDIFNGTNAAAAPPLDGYSFEASFYGGALGGVALSARLGETTTVNYNVRGDDSSFRQILQGAYMLAAVDVESLAGTPAYQPFIEAALDRLTGGLTALQEQTAALGAVQQQSERATDILSARKVLLNNSIVTAEEADLFETNLRMEEIEKQLEATYAATARVSRLRLTNYL